MDNIIDGRGLSCPQPVLMTLKDIKQGRTSEIVVLVDTDSARENVCRAVSDQGWQVKSIDPEGEGFRITVVKG